MTGVQTCALPIFIVDKHRGSLSFESVAGVGTTFLIRLPLEAAEVEAIAA